MNLEVRSGQKIKKIPKYLQIHSKTVLFLALFGLFFSFFIADFFLRMIQLHQRGSVIVDYDYSLFDIITSPEYLLGSLAILASLAVYPLLFFLLDGAERSW